MKKNESLTKINATRYKQLAIGAVSLLAVVSAGAAVASSFGFTFVSPTGSKTVNSSVSSSSLITIAGSFAFLPTLFSLSGSSTSGAASKSFPIQASAPRSNSGSERPASQTSQMDLGINLTSPSYYQNERSFMNLTAGSSWILQIGTNPLQAMPADRLDVSGALKTLNSGEKAIRILSLPNAAYRGENVRVACRWQGDGDLSMSSFVAENVARGDHNISFTWATRGLKNVHVYVTRSNSSDPVRNLDCREADAPVNTTFHPDFVQSLNPYNTIRFMDWANTNKNMPVTWATRTTPTSSLIFGTDGVAVENMVALANQAHKNVWFTMPWNADDDYIRRFAKYVRDNLSSDLKIYVETSNEVWNYMFPVAMQALTEGRQEGLDSNDYTAHMKRYAEKSTQVMKIWTEVFSGRQDRLIRVASTQNGSAASINKILSFRDTAQYIDAVATAPYFGHTIFKNDPNLSDISAIFSLIEQEIDKSIEKAKVSSDTAKEFGKAYIAYEAGQHLITSDVSLLQRVQRDPRMKDAYDRYLEKWKTNFGGLMSLFADVGPISKYGAWGLREYPGQPLEETPKMRSVLSFDKTR